MADASPDAVGRRMVDIAEERGVEPFDAMMDLAGAEPDLMLRISVVLANDDVDGVTALLQDPNTTLGLSDAGAHVGPPEVGFPEKTLTRGRHEASPECDA